MEDIWISLAPSKWTFNQKLNIAENVCVKVVDQCKDQAYIKDGYR